MSEPTKAEQTFIEQMTRKLLVGWADCQVQGVEVPVGKAGKSSPYLQFAISKGWLSKDGTKVLSTGFTTAAAFLKR